MFPEWLPTDFEARVPNGGRRRGYIGATGRGVLMLSPSDAFADDHV